MIIGRLRKYEDANYASIFSSDFKTTRCKFDNNASWGKIPYPELEDVAINNKCMAECPYCYISAIKGGKNFENIVEKALDYYGNLSENDKPFQIAIGGAGEPTLHPQFSEFVKTIRSIGIIPNYTTNGMHLSHKVLNATKEYCGGVAVSWHPHLGYEHFTKAINKLKDYTNKLNVHIIVGQEGSLEDVKRIYNDFKDVIDYFVLLPYQKTGRGTENIDNQIHKDIFEYVESTGNKYQFAFGALYYEYLLDGNNTLGIDMYEPEQFSGYRVFDDTYKQLRYSSYDRRFKE